VETLHQQHHLKEITAVLRFLRAVLELVAVVALALLGEMVLQAQVEMAVLELRQVLLDRPSRMPGVVAVVAQVLSELAVLVAVEAAQDKPRRRLQPLAQSTLAAVVVVATQINSHPQQAALASSS
jgi:hypothetical protein